MIPMKTAVCIETLINSEQSEEIVKYIMERFANESVRNARSLLEYSNHLLDMIIEKENSRKNELAHALKMMMLQCSFDKIPGGYDLGVKFSVMLPVCKTLFPNGREDCRSAADKKYFDEFVSLLHDDKVFSWDKDSVWAESNKYSDYIKVIEKRTEE